ncbi:MAG: hypothetical protein ACFFAJ_16365, partial [Candidatus Hodarchaeota archaeon]
LLALFSPMSYCTKLVYKFCAIAQNPKKTFFNYYRFLWVFKYGRGAFNQQDLSFIGCRNVPNKH